MKKYLLSLILVSGAILAMNAPMAGPVGALAEYKKTLTPIYNPLGETPFKLNENVTKQGDKTLVIVIRQPGVVSPVGPGVFYIARFDDNGSLDESFGGTGVGLTFPIMNRLLGGEITDPIKVESVQVLSDNTILISGSVGDKSFEVHLSQDGNKITKIKK